VLEITERARLGRADVVRRQALRLRALGFRVAIDDMGAGYAGLASLALIEPEIVKIDMSLVRGIEASLTRHRLVAALAQACFGLGYRVVAEGVETAAERDALVGIGVSLLQGYLFAKPTKDFLPPAFP
jgi:EAL domain-containing protein (putative c-di-GMP-specific phosphodiesterase class I)